MSSRNIIRDKDFVAIIMPPEGFSDKGKCSEHIYAANLEQICELRKYLAILFAMENILTCHMTMIHDWHVIFKWVIGIREAIKIKINN